MTVLLIILATWFVLAILIAGVIGITHPKDDWND